MKEISKDDLLDEIKKALRSEEIAIQVYVRDIVSVLPLSGLPQEKQDELKNIMQSIVDDSKEHKRKLEIVYDKVSKGVR